MTSLWTTLSVPWTLDYHDTYFAFTLAKTGPVVLVLSQLDDRYYRGLEGQYRFGLNFRLHKIGQEDYVVRTISPYCQTRSVNVELELEAGEYTVLLKVNATRDRDVLPIEEVVRRNARDRRDKLVAVGMSYDLAHSKGQVPTGETAEERRAKREAENRRKEKNRDDFRKVIMKDRVDDHYLKVKAWQRRLKRKTNAKAKAKAKAAREAEKEKKAKARNEAKDVQEKPKDDVEASENSAFATPQETGTDAKDTDRGSSENKKEAHVHIVAPDEIPSPEGFKAAGSEPGVNTPSSESNESPSNVSPKSEKPTAESSENLADDSKAAEDKPDTKEEAEASNSHEDAIKVIQGKEENEKLGGKSEGPSKEEDIVKHENIPEDYKDSPLEEDGEDDQDDEDDEISSLSSFSDLSDRELDIRLERMAEADAQPLAPGSPQQRPRSRPPPAPAPQGDDDEPDEFESDPWNAVATVGLRVYHKVADEDDRDREMVRLRVVRPNPFLAGKEGKGKEDGDENRDKKDSGGDKEGKGNEKDKEKEKGEDDKKEEVVDEPKSSQGLDVDDSSKDATLVGDQEQRRKSILSLIPPRQG